MSTRLDNLRKTLTAQNLDAFVILNAKNIRYLTSFTGTAGVLFVTPDSAKLFVDGRYTEQAKRQVQGGEVVAAPRPVLDYAANQYKGKVKRVGFEGNNLTFADYENLHALFSGVELVGLRGVVERLRMIKDAQELEYLKKAIQIADDVFDQFCEWLEPGMVESQAAARLEYEQRVAGGDRKFSETIVSSGERTALPHGIATDRVINNNEPVMIDIGAIIKGYTSDLTRTVFLGKAPEEYKKLYQIVYDAQQRALDGIRAGITGKDADALARDVINAAGYEGKFEHSLGHCIGLDIHEQPLLNPKDLSVLEENMVFTVEPGIYLPGQWGVRIEDVVRITKDGCEKLTNSTRLLREI